jgi:hypothetical protein
MFRYVREMVPPIRYTPDGVYRLPTGVRTIPVAESASKDFGESLPLVETSNCYVLGFVVTVVDPKLL